MCEGKLSQILFEKIFDDAIYFHEQKKPLVGGFF